MFMHLYNRLNTARSRAPLPCPPGLRPLWRGGFLSRRRSRLLRRCRRGLRTAAPERQIYSTPEFRHVRLQYGRTGFVVHELPVLPRLHQAGARELLEMVRDRRLAYGKAAAEMAASHFGLFGDVLEYLEASRVSQCLGDPLELLGIHDYLPALIIR